MEENKCAVCTINVYFYTINVVYMVCGITFVILGILMELIPSVHHEILSAELVIPPIILITVGALMLVVSFIGYCGSRIDHYCMLVTYVCLAIFFLLFTIGAAVALLVFPVHITDAIKNQMKTEQETYSTSASSRRYWDKFHSMFQCCGIYNTSEWLEIQKYIPISCCQPIPDDDDEEEDSHCKSKNKRKPFLREIGCLQRLDSAYLRYSIIIMVCSIIACIIQGLCIVLITYRLWHYKRRKRRLLEQANQYLNLQQTQSKKNIDKDIQTNLIEV